MSAKNFLKHLLRSCLGRGIVKLSQSVPGLGFVLSSCYDPASGFQVGTGDMRQDWDDRARRNPRFFTSVDAADFPESYDDSGSRHLDLILRGISWNSAWRVLEIGCGIGRLLKPLSERVAEAHGVDISPEMVCQAKDNLAERRNAHACVTQGDLAGFETESFDFVYSYRVFQHMPDRTAIMRYLHEASRVLKPGGWFRFQICTGENLGRRAMLGGTWFGVLFREDEIPELIHSAGFALHSIEREASDAQQALWIYQIVTCRRPEDNVSDGTTNESMPRMAGR